MSLAHFSDYHVGQCPACVHYCIRASIDSLSGSLLNRATEALKECHPSLLVCLAVLRGQLRVSLK